MWYQIKGNYIYITVSAKPNAKKSACLGVRGDALKITLHAQPVDGKANVELVKFFAEFFQLKKSEVEIIRGESAKLKVVKLPLSENLKTIVSQLINF